MTGGLVGSVVMVRLAQHWTDPDLQTRGNETKASLLFHSPELSICTDPRDTGYCRAQTTAACWGLAGSAGRYSWDWSSTASPLKLRVMGSSRNCRLADLGSSRCLITWSNWRCWKSVVDAAFCVSRMLAMVFSSSSAEASCL